VAVVPTVVITELVPPWQFVGMTEAGPDGMKLAASTWVALLTSRSAAADIAESRERRMLITEAPKMFRCI
jgi:hypothetical protein